MQDDQRVAGTQSPDHARSTNWSAFVVVFVTHVAGPGPLLISCLLGIPVFTTEMIVRHHAISET